MFTIHNKPRYLWPPDGSPQHRDLFTQKPPLRSTAGRHGTGTFLGAFLSHRSSNDRRPSYTDPRPMVVGWLHSATSESTTAVCVQRNSGWDGGILTQEWRARFACVCFTASKGVWDGGILTHWEWRARFACVCITASKGVSLKELWNAGRGSDRV